MSTQLGLWQELTLLGLAALSLVYVLYFKIWLAVAFGSDLLFLVALVMTVASVTAPEPYRRGAAELVDRSPLPEALRQADAKVAALEALPGRLIDRALAKIGYERDATPASREPPASSESGAAAAALAGAEVSGPFMNAIRPSVETLVSTVLRLACFACGSFLLLTALAMRSSTTTARQLHRLGGRVTALEARISSRAEAEPTEPGTGSTP